MCWPQSPLRRPSKDKSSSMSGQWMPSSSTSMLFNWSGVASSSRQLPTIGKEKETPLGSETETRPSAYVAVGTLSVKEFMPFLFQQLDFLLGNLLCTLQLGNFHALGLNKLNTVGMIHVLLVVGNYTKIRQPLRVGILQSTKQTPSSLHLSRCFPCIQQSVATVFHHVFATPFAENSTQSAASRPTTPQPSSAPDLHRPRKSYRRLPEAGS